MSAIAIVGTPATTTTVALAAAWPGPEAPVVIEADPRGGSLAAWLDVPTTPSLSTAVASGAHRDPEAVAALVRTTPSGVRLLPAPVRSVEARRSVAEAEAVLVPALAASDEHLVLLDLGRRSAADALAPLHSCDVCVVVHRQADQSSRAAVVGVERLAELVDVVAESGVAVVVAVVGAQPFDPREVGGFVVGARTDIATVALPVDPVAAAVLGGRSGVSARRLARLPLLRAARQLAGVVEHERTRMRASVEVGS
jgi:MinD-like ATPase involved in chromosome partitioning or flagellar assembly